MSAQSVQAKEEYALSLFDPKALGDPLGGAVGLFGGTEHLLFDQERLHILPRWDWVRLVMVLRQRVREDSRRLL